MMKEKVILTTLTISQVGQVLSFQVKIPRDAKRIIGIESSISRLAIPSPGGGGSGGLGGPAGGGMGGSGSTNLFGVLLNSNSPMGEFKLQSCGDANIFYSDTIYLDDTNIGQGDFSASVQFMPKDFSHLSKQLEDEANEDGSATLIKGIYRDIQNPASTTAYSYRANIYVWVELNLKAE